MNIIFLFGLLMTILAAIFEAVTLKMPCFERNASRRFCLLVCIRSSPFKPILAGAYRGQPEEAQRVACDDRRGR